MGGDTLIKEWCVILNPKANDGTALYEWSKIKEQLNIHNFEYNLLATESKRHAVDLTTEAIRDGHRKIIVVGGAGTLNEVVNGIMTQNYCHSSEITITNIPVGAFNDWAKHHNIPTNYKKWIPKIKEAQVKQHDLGKFTYMYRGIKGEAFFLGFMGTGIAASVVKRINDSSMNLTDRSTLLQHVVKAGIQFKKDTLAVNFNNTQFTRDFLYFNASIARYAAGFALIQDKNIESGKLYISYNVENMSYSNLVNMYYNLFINKKLAGNHIEYATATSCSINATGDRLGYVTADGEFFGHAPSEIRIIPNALSVLVP